jgi:hypothetical protein
MPSSVVSKLPSGLPVYELVSTNEGDGTVYAVSGKTLYPIGGPQFAHVWNFSFPEVGHVPSYLLNDYTASNLLGRMCIIAGGDGTVYMLDQGVAYKISSAMAKAWKLDLSVLSQLPAALIADRVDGGLLTNLARVSDGDGTIYLIKDGKKYPIRRSTWISRRYNAADVRVVSTLLLQPLPTGSVQ